MRSAPDAIILCGGAGSRLRALTDGPKAMVPVGGRPFLELLLRQLRRWGIERVILAVGYRGAAIRAHLGDHAFGLRLLYSQELIPLGTGGALRNAADLVESSLALVLNGDSYTNADFGQFLLHHYESGSDMSVLVVPPDGRADCGTVLVDTSGRLLAFQEKRSDSGSTFMNAGIYLFSREMLRAIAGGGEVSLERELLPRWLDQGRIIRVAIDHATCYDIGTPERYQSAQRALAGVEAGQTPAVPGTGL